jgi:hypothetical protein
LVHAIGAIPSFAVSVIVCDISNSNAPERPALDAIFARSEYRIA